MIESIKIKTQYTTFWPWLQANNKRLQTIITTKREKRHVRATGQRIDVLIRIPHLSGTFSVPYYTYQPKLFEQEGKGPNICKSE